MLGGLCSHTTLPAPSSSTSRFGPLPYSNNISRCSIGESAHTQLSPQQIVNANTARNLERLIGTSCQDLTDCRKPTFTDSQASVGATDNSPAFQRVVSRNRSNRTHGRRSKLVCFKLHAKITILVHKV